MNPPIDLFDVIATSEGVVRGTDGSEWPLWITVGRPFCPDPERITWYCSYRIRLGDARTTESSMAGTDGVEALTNAVVALAFAVEDLRPEADVSFYGQPNFAPEFFLAHRKGIPPSEEEPLHQDDH